MPELCFKGGGNNFFRKYEIAVICCNTYLTLYFLNCLMIFEWTLFTHSCFRACIFTSNLHREDWSQSVWCRANANSCFSKDFYFIMSVRHLHYLWKLPVMGCLQLPWLTGFSQAVWKLLWSFPLCWHRISDGTSLRLQLCLTYKNAPKFSALLCGRLF